MSKNYIKAYIDGLFYRIYRIPKFCIPDAITTYGDQAYQIINDFYLSDLHNGSYHELDVYICHENKKHDKKLIGASSFITKQGEFNKTTLSFSHTTYRFNTAIENLECPHGRNPISTILTANQIVIPNKNLTVWG